MHKLARINIERISLWDSAVAVARLKSRPEDFQVTEVTKHEPVGSGEHLWLWIRKVNANTDWVADELSRQVGLKRRDVSYAGRKDRLALTEQWFSLYDPKKLSAEIEFDIQGAEVLKRTRHQQKLRTGQLLGNRFRIILRDVEGDCEQIDQRLRFIKVNGFPNYFGEQRFGHQGQNLSAAMAWVKAGGKRINRNKRSIYLSSLRSYIFNTLLSERVGEHSWNRLLLGELTKLSGSNSGFIVENIEVEQKRCDVFDIDPTGPLVGKVKRSAKYEAKALEDRVLSDNAEIVAFLKQHMDADRRSLRVMPKEMHWELSGDTLIVSFFLPKGSYATVLLEQIFELRQS